MISQRPENKATANRHIAKLLDLLEAMNIDVPRVRKVVMAHMHNLAADVEARYITESVCNPDDQG
jgi:hypothetical protein